MDWLNGLGFSLSGLPWWAAFLLAIATFAATKGIDGWLKLRRSRLEERQYEDGETKLGYQALIEELKTQVKELKADVNSMVGELREVRAAHTKCEVEQATLRGELKLMNERLDRLAAHDEANKKHLEQLKAVVIEEVPKTPGTA